MTINEYVCFGFKHYTSAINFFKPSYCLIYPDKQLYPTLDAHQKKFVRLFYYQHNEEPVRQIIAQCKTNCFEPALRDNLRVHYNVSEAHSL